MIAHARRDERGQYSGGIAGDQDGQEVSITPWYNRPWSHIIRHPVAKVRWAIADAAEAICNNNKIGYDQGGRTTLYARAKEVNFDFSKIVTPCECDCSSMVAVCVNAAGIAVNHQMYTGNEVKTLERAGFQIITNAKWRESEDYLVRGDILLYEGHHTAICINDGKLASLYRKGWNKDGNRWWYADTATTYLYDTWQVINHYVYYFDSDGYMVTGVKRIEGKSYYFNDGDRTLEGALCTTDSMGALSPMYID